MTETIEQAAERYAEAYRCPATNEKEYCKHDIISAVKFGVEWQSSQPNPHRIKEWQVMELNDMYFTEQISHNRMVEILNEIAAGKHKERIEL
jgi:hypothetical protein